jgi:hypothetical protein
MSSFSGKINLALSGPLAMHQQAEGKFDIMEPHTYSGQIALWLMLIHAI